MGTEFRWLFRSPGLIVTIRSKHSLLLTLSQPYRDSEGVRAIGLIVLSATVVMTRRRFGKAYEPVG